jgi:hypothetical protein
MLGTTARQRRGSTRLRALIPALALVFGACDEPLDPELALILSQASVEFRALRGSTASLSQTVTVANAGGGRLGPISCNPAPASWLSCSVANGNVVTLTANPATLTQTPPQATVTLTAPGAASGVSLQVSLRVDQPVLTLATSTASFTATEGGTTTSPATSSVTLSNTGVGSLADLGSITCAPTPANTRVTCTVNQSTGVLSVAVNPAGLTPGTYLFPVTVGAANSGVSQTFSVALTVGALPRTVLSRQSLHFQLQRGTTTPQTQTVTVTNSGGGSLGTITCSSPVSWLTCSVSANTVSITANPTGLTSPPAAANVSIVAAGAANNPQLVAVTLGLDQPILTVSNSAVVFTAAEGSSVTSPSSQTVTVSNTGPGTDASLGVISCSVDAPVACQVDGNQLTITANPTNLTAGVTVHQVTVTAENSNVSRTIAVAINVTRPITVAPSTVNFTATNGSTTPQSQTVTVSYPSGTLGTLSCPATPISWLTCTPGTNTVTFTMNPTGVTSGNTVDVPITATAVTTGDQGTATVRVTLTIQ